MFETSIVSAMVHVGSGSPGQKMSFAIKDGGIAAIAGLPGASAKHHISVNGLPLAPGKRVN